MAYIYKITNNINNKIYIGKTENSIEKRFKEHCSDAFKEKNEKRPLYAAMRKYGIENFSIEKIEETNIPEKRETYWIEYYGSFKNGYNATMGGDGKKYLDYNLICETYNQTKNLKKTAELCNCCTDSVRNILSQYKIEIMPSTEINKQELSKMINQYDLNNNYIKTFSSYSEAARWLVDNNYAKGDIRGILSHIRDCAKGKRKTAYKFVWKFPNL